MQLGVTIITRESLSSGFGLAGVETMSVSNVEDVRKALSACTARRDWNLVLVEESLFSGLSKEDQRDFEELGMPLVVPLPLHASLAEQDADGAARTRVADLVQHAIGKRLAI
jgi:vacuolar-type H+-ATPase subunit F/Vma7